MKAVRSFTTNSLVLLIPSKNAVIFTTSVPMLLHHKTQTQSRKIYYIHHLVANAAIHNDRKPYYYPFSKFIYFVVARLSHPLPLHATFRCYCFVCALVRTFCLVHCCCIASVALLSPVLTFCIASNRNAH